MISNADNQINLVSRKIDSLNNSNVLLYSRLDSVKTNNAGIEREVGGFLFVAKTFNIPLNKAVNWFIMLIVFVFDPLAIALLLAFNQQKLLPVEVPIEHYEAKRGRPKKKL
jgi:hypothetical protein